MTPISINGTHNSNPFNTGEPKEEAWDMPWCLLAAMVVGFIVGALFL